MLLFCLCLSFIFGASGYDRKEVCYGADFSLNTPVNVRPLGANIYFSPKEGNRTNRLVVVNGTSNDPRFKITSYSVTLRDVNDKDDGLFLFSRDNSEPDVFARLIVLECAETVERWHDSSFRRALNRGWESVEFYSGRHPYVKEILLNRSDPSTYDTGRMRLKDGGVQMLHLARPDQGYYHVRGKDKILSRIKLQILIHHRRLEVVEDEDYTIQYPTQFTPWFANFTADEVQMLMVDGKWQDVVLSNERMQPQLDGLKISPVLMSDHGWYGFYDENRNLVLFLKLTVNAASFPLHLVIFISLAVLLLLLCCVGLCVRRKCQERKIRRNYEANLASAAAARGCSAASQGASRSSAPESAAFINVLSLGQSYQISLRLEMPDSPINQQLGMFMIRTTCFPSDEDQLTSSHSANQPQTVSTARFSMLKYRSGLLRTIGTLLFFPAFMTGVSEQKQVLEVELFADFVDNSYNPCVTAMLEIMNNKVQIYSSELQIHARFTGLRYLLFHFPLLSALAGVSSNFIFLSIIFILSYTRMIWNVPGRSSSQTRSLTSEPENNQREIVNRSSDAVEMPVPHPSNTNGEVTEQSE